MRKIIFASILIIILVTIITPLVYSLADYRYYTRVTFTNSTAADVTGRYVASINADGLIDQGFMQADADDARIDYETDAVMKSGTFGELNQTAAYWYSDIITVPAYSSVSRDIWTGNGSATARDQSWVGDDGDVNTVADDASLDITTNLTLSAQVNLSALPVPEGTLTNGGGTFTGSPIHLVSGVNTIACTVAGTATIVLAPGVTGTVATGTMTVDLSPVALVAGSNTITTSGVIGNIVVTLNAGVEKEIISKEGNYELAVNATHYIFRVWKVGVPVVGAEFNPIGGGTYTNLTPSVGANWSCVDEVAPLGAGSDGDYVGTATQGVTRIDTYATDIPAGSTITSVNVYYRARQNVGPPWGTFTPVCYDSSNPVAGLISGASWTPAAVGWANNGPIAIAYTGSAEWLEIGIQIDTMDVAANWQMSQLYAIISYTPPDAGHVSQIAAGTGQKNLTCTYDGGTNLINITDGILTDPQVLAGALFTNREAIDIAIVDGKVDDIKIGDTSIAAPTWKLNLEFEADEINGVAAVTTVTDLSASTNDMSSTRTGNPAGVTTTVSGILPVVSSSVPLVGQEALISDAAKDFNPQAYNISEAGSSLTNAQIPGLIINTASEASGVDTHWVWWFIYGLICICLFLVGMRFLGGHITISWVMVIITTACFVSWDVVPWWFILIYSIFAIGSLAWENRTNI